MKTTLATAAILLAFGLVWAQPQPGCPMAARTAEPGAEPLIQEPAAPELPDLTEAQQVQMDDLRLAHLREMLPLETDLRVREIELDALWRADKLDARKLTGKVKEISELRGRVELARVEHRIAVAGILTKEQRKAFLGRGRRGMMGMRGMGRGMMRGNMGRGGACAPGAGACPQPCPDCQSD
jgi:Spy/CpxP family protein refolding chaperone